MTSYTGRVNDDDDRWLIDREIDKQVYITHEVKFF